MLKFCSGIIALLVMLVWGCTTTLEARVDENPTEKVARELAEEDCARSKHKNTCIKIIMSAVRDCAPYQRLHDRQGFLQCFSRRIRHHLQEAQIGFLFATDRESKAYRWVFLGIDQKGNAHCDGLMRRDFEGTARYVIHSPAGNFLATHRGEWHPFFDTKADCSQFGRNVDKRPYYVFGGASAKGHPICKRGKGYIGYARSLRKALLKGWTVVADDHDILLMRTRSDFIIVASNLTSCNQVLSVIQKSLTNVREDDPTRGML